MPEPHNNDNNPRKMWTNQWTSSRNESVDQLGPVYTAAQVSSRKTVDQLEEQPSRLHHTLLGLASRGLIRQDLLRRLLDWRGSKFLGTRLDAYKAPAALPSPHYQVRSLQVWLSGRPQAQV